MAKNKKIKRLNGTLRKYQRRGVNMMLKKYNGACLNADDCGLGKAQPLTSSVYTPTGPKQMKDIKVKDIICIPNNSTAKVIGVYPQGIKEVYLVTFTDGSTTKCCREHLWSINSSTGRARGTCNKIWPLQDFMDNLKDSSGSSKWFIPKTGIIQLKSQEVNMNPYLLGVLIGDGGIKYRLILTTSYDDLKEEVEKVLLLSHPNIRLKKIGDSISFRLNQINRKYRNELVTSLKEMKLFGCGSADKFIPKEYLYNSFDVRQSILQGLIDTDGYISKEGTVQYCTASKQLCLDVQELVNSLGGFARINLKTNVKGYEDRIYYTLTINLPANIKIARTKRRLDRYSLRKRKYEPVRAFKSVEYIGEEECQCIAIDSKDKLYLTDQGIVTHNTIQSIEVVARNEGKMSVIAVPNFVKVNWADEFKEFLPDEKLYICQGQKSKSLKGFVGTVIINYDILNHWKEELIKSGVRVFICDESHLLKNNTKRTKAAIKIARNCEIKILLSGTPIEKNPGDLYYQLKIIRPDLFTSQLKFIKRYNSAVKTRWGWTLGRAINMKELHETLLRECMFRRLKEDVLPELPDKIRQVIPLNITNRKEYDAAEENIIAWIRNNTKLNIEKAKKNEQLAKLDKLKLISAMGKLKQIVEWIESEQEITKLVVFCHHKKVLRELRKSLPKAVVISSEMSNAERKMAQHRFNKDDKVRTLLTTIRVGGTGLNFQEGSSTTVFVQLDWNSARHDQAEDRVYRIGQEADSVRAIYFIAQDTIEQKLMMMIDETRITSGKAIDGVDGKDSDMLTKLLESFK